MTRRIEEVPTTGMSSSEEWADIVSRWHDGWRVQPGGSWNSPHVASYCLGEVTVVGCRTGACAGSRVADRDGTDKGRADVAVLVLHSGREIVEEGSRQVLLSAGDAIIWDTRMSGRFAVDDSVDKSTIFLPRAVVESWVPSLDRLMVRGPVPAACTTALRGLLRGVAETPSAELERQNAEILASALRETAFLALSGLEPVAANRGGRFWNALTRTIETRLPLAPTAEELAVELSVSVRTVYQVFADNGTTVRAYIKRRRLARAREELLDSRRDDSVATIARRWGFVDQSAFTKAFRQQFDITPSMVKRSAARG
ncbi:helix-turn-helix domain-containing protein [Pseudonocardia endophytica]|uniref:AraC family transcriptional regulator n=1 Tax=Pseudonocardia endophytica TaxID=401976 RepID=A0A4V2PHW1_PSEEN|nr:helix-turn-helix domain-containing protein [Pseudonocardia endophytica]TCK21976.1 AraC family transcriptional regulator [Pseudonocardia endophytica]